MRRDGGKISEVRWQEKVTAEHAKNAEKRLYYLKETDNMRQRERDKQ
jgi:hypothetical protein